MTALPLNIKNSRYLPYTWDCPSHRQLTGWNDCLQGRRPWVLSQLCATCSCCHLSRISEQRQENYKSKFVIPYIDNLTPHWHVCYLTQKRKISETLMFGNWLIYCHNFTFHKKKLFLSELILIKECHSLEIDNPK